ncbi:phospho-N-acetylmuramoyl-pentapeptide-transferase [Candidatus Dependentiae bacterium]|nr:phospho-N-acetylmuramoyl-pentapeptide-transferase [Candidatus Dependentiae bacterium]MBU4387716.1 phospho-N-acetylmuramoyl-pentapeptide-transferase [Candidatus Dependentiae bacterium]MCG2756416.1 phospho-N-acetylmuramoyl-pentapeptide-transferase [Candidatus Dependentiae bacterium]
MLYHLSNLLKFKYGFLNIFHYVSVRVIAALLTSIILSFMFGDWFIDKSKKSFRSKVREWIPDSHQSKNDTPTMGGLFILMVFVINLFLWCDLTSPVVWLFSLGTLGFGLIGFLDDWKKIKFNKGISAKLKSRLQLLIATLFSLAWYFILKPDTHLCVPFFKNFNPDLGLLIIPWAIFIIIGTSNAVNLTDGLDGLAAGPLMFNFATYAMIAYLAGHKYFAQYLYIPYVGSSDLSVLVATLIGALLGFLWYNTYPAQIFMGDVGSMAMGAALAFVALMTKQELLLPIAGGIFVLETVSVIIQVVSYKLLGRRVFKMAPIHHHYELMGWNEAKITVRFWIISIILSLLTLLTLKIR